jgi:hypothetical protein
MNKFIIQNKNEYDLFWNNEYGWVDFDTADIFHKDDVKTFNLPIEGKLMSVDLFDTVVDSF